MQTKKLTNIQHELLKIFQYDLQEKQLLSNYFANKTIAEADELWVKKNLSDNDMNKWLNGHS